MKDAAQYPVTFGYRAIEMPYYGPGGSVGPYHRGNDHAMPVGTPVIINGNIIGLSGNTGTSSGPHLHIGAFVGGKDVDPGPYEFKAGEVTQVNEDSVNGKYVRIQVGGASVVYLHLSEQLATKGQDLTQAGQGGEDMSEPVNRGDIVNIYRVAIGREPNDNDFTAWDGKEWKDFTYDLVQRPDFVGNQPKPAPSDADKKLNQIKEILK